MARLLQCDICEVQYFDKRNDKRIKITYNNKDVQAYVSFGDAEEGYGSYDTCDSCFEALKNLISSAT